RENLDRDAYAFLRLSVEAKEGHSLSQIASHIAGLWSSDISSDGSHQCRVIGEPEAMVELAVPLALLRPTLGLTQMLNILSVPPEYEHCKRLLYEWVEFPGPALDAYRGPRHGVEGIRLAFQAGEGPLLGAILKPRLISDLTTTLEAVRKVAS